MPNGLVTVVIPVYNGERFLAEAIESVLNQTYKPIELIVVDDESTDNSAQVAEGYADKGVKLIRNSPNAGVGAARNRGIEIAKGDYITNLDADDMMVPERVAKQVRAIEDGAEFVLTREQLFTESGVERPAFFTGKLAPISSEIEDIYQTMSWLASREAVEKVGLFDESLRYGEDVDYCLRATDAGLRVEHLDERLTLRRLHGDNMTYDYKQTRGAAFQAFKLRIERHRSAAAPPSGTATDAPPPTEG